MPNIIKDNGPTLNVNCGDCIHLRDVPAFAEVCEKLGVRDYAKPCGKFQMNWKNFQFSQEFASLLKSTATPHLNKMIALFNAEVYTRKAKMYFGMPVYIRLFGDDYISNYVKCYVVSAQGRYVYVHGIKLNYYGVFLKKNVYNEANFIKKIKELTEARKYRDPKLETYTDWKPAKKGPISIKEIPMIDDLPFKSTSMSFTVNEFDN